MAEKELTNKEREFAKVLVAGATQAEAYAAAYSAEGSKATKRANGFRISKRCHVAAEIKKLRHRPAIDDYTAIKTKMIERLLELADNDGNSVAQHRAIVTLLKYADESAERQVAKELDPEIAALVDELTSNAAPHDSLDSDEVETLAAGDIAETVPVQRKSYLGDDRRSTLARFQFAATTNPSNAATQSNAAAFVARRAAESREREEAVRKNREDVRRLTAIYRERREAARALVAEPATAEEPGREDGRDLSIGDSGFTAAPQVQVSGPRPRFRKIPIPGRFPPQWRLVPDFEGGDG